MRNIGDILYKVSITLSLIISNKVSHAKPFRSGYLIFGA